MPIIAVAHVLVALFFAVHSVRTRQNMYWLIILFSFPFLGSVVYFFSVYLPSTRLEQQARKAISSAAKMLDPERELREASDAFDETPTVNNRLRLADAQFERGLFSEAISNYRGCLEGPFASDPLLRVKVARCLVENGHPEQALDTLEQLREESGNAENETFSLLLAQAYAATGRHTEARAEFEHASSRYGSFQVLAEYAIWALGRRDVHTAAKLTEEIERKTRRWGKNTRQLNKSTMVRLDAAYRLALESDDKYG